MTIGPSWSRGNGDILARGRQAGRIAAFVFVVEFGDREGRRRVVWCEKVSGAREYIEGCEGTGATVFDG